MKFVNEDKVIALFGYWPQFCDAKLLKLNFDFINIMEDNVFDELSIKPITSHSIQVRLDSCYGLNGSFRCKSAEVLDVSQ
jgi:hypothetical protein